MIYRQKTIIQEKAHRCRAGLSIFLCNYMLASSIQLANCDNSISRASNATGGV